MLHFKQIDFDKVRVYSDSKEELHPFHGMMLVSKVSPVQKGELNGKSMWYVEYTKDGYDATGIWIKEIELIKMRVKNQLTPESVLCTAIAAAATADKFEMDNILDYAVHNVETEKIENDEYQVYYTIKVVLVYFGFEDVYSYHRVVIDDDNMIYSIERLKS